MMLRAALALFVLSTAAHAQNEFKVKVIEVKGSAETRAAVDQPWSELKEGMTITNNAWIQTGLKSRVYLKFGDNTVVQVKSATLLQITDAAKNGNQLTAKLKLALGHVHVEVQKSSETVDFKVVTPDVTTSVKGTGYSAKHYSDMGSKVEVDHGIVGTSNRSTDRDVTAGKSTDSRLLPADLQSQISIYIPTAFDSLLISGDTKIEYISPDAELVGSNSTTTAIKVESSETGTTTGGTTNPNAGTGTSDGGLPPVPLEPVDGGTTTTTLP